MYLNGHLAGESLGYHAGHALFSHNVIQQL